MKLRTACLLAISLAGCDAQMKTTALLPADQGSHLEMTTDEDGRTRLEQSHEYRLGGVELKSQ